MLLACAHSSVNLLHDGWMKCRRPKKEDESIDLQFYGNETSSECFEMILDFMLMDLSANIERGFVWLFEAQREQLKLLN